jgi:hypothetical protein
MYQFAILLFGGLAVWLVGKLLAQHGPDMARASSLVLMAGLGVGYAYLVNYSLFSGWHAAVRNDTIGHIVTGFIVAGVAMLWDEALDFMRAYAGSHGSESKKQLRRAA